MFQGAFVGVTDTGSVKLDPVPQSKVFIRSHGKSIDSAMSIRAYLERQAKASRTEYYLLPRGDQFVCPLRSDVPHGNVAGEPVIQISDNSGGLNDVMPYAVFRRR